MLKVMYDYDGLAYTVVPCWITEDSRLHYCGAFATSRESWKRVMELIEEALCFLGALGWLSFLGYTFAKAVFER